jgi:hypothetical protein
MRDEDYVSWPQSSHLVPHPSFLHMARSGKLRRRSALDLEEIAPSRFLVHNLRVNALLKGEGAITGRMFELQTWRREGLLARLRERGFAVRTIADRLDALPEPPAAPPIGRIGWRPLANAIEQISHFDLRRLHWHPLAAETRDGVAGVAVYEGWVLRRRKGRGASAYHMAVAERGGGIGLRPLDETEAILIGYAQSLELDRRPLLAERRPSSSSGQGGEQLLLPDVVLPPPYREVLELIATSSAEGPLVDQRGWPIAQELFGRLGMRLTVEG